MSASSRVEDGEHIFRSILRVNDFAYFNTHDIIMRMSPGINNGHHIYKYEKDIKTVSTWQSWHNYAIYDLSLSYNDRYVLTNNLAFCKRFSVVCT
jgi:hypothetical protein